MSGDQIVTFSEKMRIDANGNFGIGFGFPGSRVSNEWTDNYDVIVSHQDEIIDYLKEKYPEDFV